MYPQADMEDVFENYTFCVTPEEDGLRMDVFLCHQNLEISRTAAVRLITEKLVTLNEKTVSKKDLVHAGDRVDVQLPPPAEIPLLPEDIPLDIMYQDQDIAVINKPQGMVVHPAHGNQDGTLVNAILYHIQDLSGINGELRPGIVHRLDKNTSGLIIIAKNDIAHRSLAEQFKERTCEKKYLALAEGVFPQKHYLIETLIARDTADRKKMAVSAHNGRFASTEITVLEQFRDTALVECLLHTGRTHQIRVHLAHIGHPCVGDTVYGFQKNRYGLAGQALHAASLTITHPRTGERMNFIAPLPVYMEELLAKFRRQHTL